MRNHYKTRFTVLKMMRSGDKLLLGEDYGYLEFVSLKSHQITQAHNFTELGKIKDIIDVNDSQFMLAGNPGVMRITESGEVIKHSF